MTPLIVLSLQIIFILLNVAHCVSWSWLIVFMPVILLFATQIIVLIILFLIMFKIFS